MDWAKNRELGALRRRVHSVANARVTVHQGAPNSAGVTGILTHCEHVMIHDNGIQTYQTRSRPVRVMFDGNNAELKCITLGELRVKELPDANNVVNVQTACSTAVGIKHLARQSSKVVGVLGSRAQAGVPTARVQGRRARHRGGPGVYSPNPENRTRFARQDDRAPGHGGAPGRQQPRGGSGRGHPAVRDQLQRAHLRRHLAGARRAPLLHRLQQHRPHARRLHPSEEARGG